MSKLEAARRMKSMLTKLLRKGLLGRRLGRKLGRRSVRSSMNDEGLRKPDGGRKRRKLRPNRRRDVRKERLGRSLKGSAKRKNFESASGIGKERGMAETVTVTGTAIEIGTETKTEIGRGTVMIEVIATEDMMMIRDPADIPIEIEKTET